MPPGVGRIKLQPVVSEEAQRRVKQIVAWRRQTLGTVIETLIDAEYERMAALQAGPKK